MESIDWSNEEYVPDYVQEAIDKSEEMRTPWFFTSYLYDFGEVYILGDLDEHEYYENGERYND